MKKIALTLAAVASLGLAACDNGATDTANEANGVTEMDATTNEAIVDVNAAAADAAVDNVVADVSNTADNASDAVENAAENATDEQ